MRAQKTIENLTESLRNVMVRSRGSLFDRRSSDHRPLSQVFKENGSRDVTKRILEGQWYEYTYSIIVLANCVVIGLEQSFRMQKKDLQTFEYFESAFLTFYIAELLAHFYAWGWRCLCNNWVRFYCLLVVLGMTCNWVITPMAGRFSSVMLLRIVRLLRVARVVRLMVAFREIRMLALGLLQSLRTLAHTLVLGGMLIYGLACIAMELIPLAHQDTNETQQVQELIESSFQSLPVTMLTLVQFLTFDNAVFIYKPLMEEEHFLGLFFMPVLGLLGVVFMNLVTATMVNGGLEQALEDKIARSAVVEARRKGLLVDLEKAFHLADTNCSGSVSRDELQAIDEEGPHALHEILGADSLVTLFDCLDVDHSGELGIEEFCHGIEGILVSQTPMAVKRLERMLESIASQVKDTQISSRRLERSVEYITAVLKPYSAGVPQPEFATTPYTPGYTPYDCQVVDQPSSQRRTSRVSLASDLNVSCSTLVEDSKQTPGFLRPTWADDLIMELKQVCYDDARRALDSACTDFIERVAKGALEQEPISPRSVGTWRTTESTDSGRDSRDEPPEQDSLYTNYEDQVAASPSDSSCASSMGSVLKGRTPTQKHDSEGEVLRTGSAVIPTARHPSLILPHTPKVMHPPPSLKRFVKQL